MVSLVTIGIGDWERWTLPLIDSVRRYEPDVPIVVVDNQSDPPYPSRDDVQIVRIPRTSYAAAINVGVRMAPDSTHYIVVNNDVLCEGPFVHHAKQQPQSVVAGNWLNHKFGREWIDGWHYCIPRGAWHVVGDFDEEFLIAGFEDADYCFRAEKKGFLVRQSKQPFRHLVGRIRWTIDDYGEQRRQNLSRLIEKHDLAKDGWHVW